ncbi:MAG TPA: VanZ family protein [Pirellulales bacterium]
MSEPIQASGTKSRLWMGCVAALVLYWIVLALVTHWPRGAPTVSVANFDKVEHLAGYFVLGSLLGACTALRYGATRRNLLIAWGVVLVYAALEEITQIPFNRQCELYDWFADAIGSGLALSLIGVGVWLNGRRSLEGRLG